MFVLTAMNLDMHALFVLNPWNILCAIKILFIINRPATKVDYVLDMNSGRTRFSLWQTLDIILY